MSLIAGPHAFQQTAEFVIHPGVLFGQAAADVISIDHGLRVAEGVEVTQGSDVTQCIGDGSQVALSVIGVGGNVRHIRARAVGGFGQA